MLKKLEQKLSEIKSYYLLMQMIANTQGIYTGFIINISKPILLWKDLKLLFVLTRNVNRPAPRN